MASGRINGVCTGNAADKYDFWVDWSSTPYAEGGYSLVSATSYLKRNDGANNSAYNLGISASKKIISIDDEIATGTTKGIDTRNNKTVTVASINNLRVEHDADGFKSIEIYSSFPSVSDTNLSGGFASKMVSLDSLDVTNPSFSKKPSIHIKTQTQFWVSFESPDKLAGIYYSIDFGKTWVQVDSQQFIINDLRPYTNYTVYVKIVRASSLAEKIETVKERTRPVYVTDIIVQDPVLADIGKPMEIPCQFLPANASIKSVRVRSTNPEVISAEGNIITGLKKGRSTLIVEAVDGSGVVTQTTAYAVVRVSGITISPSEITIANGDSITIAANVLPSDANIKGVTLSASDESLVLIEGMNVTALANGIVTITATTQDGNFKARSIITISGDYTWYDYSQPIEILNTEDIKNIQSNINTIRNMLISKGYSVSDLEDAIPDKGTHFVNVLDFLQKIEYNLDRISDNDCESIYYVEPKTVGYTALNKTDIWRWVQILNDMYEILSGQFGKWGRLVCSDGYPTIGGKKIVLRGEFVGY